MNFSHIHARLNYFVIYAGNHLFFIYILDWMLLKFLIQYQNIWLVNNTFDKARILIFIHLIIYASIYLLHCPTGLSFYFVHLILSFATSIHYSKIFNFHTFNYKWINVSIILFSWFMFLICLLNVNMLKVYSLRPKILISIHLITCG